MDIKKDILETLENLAIEYAISFVVVGSYAKGGYVYDPKNSLLENSDIEIVVYGNRIKIFIVKNRLKVFFNERNIRFSLQKGRTVKSDMESITLYEHDETRFGIRIGNFEPILPELGLVLHKMEDWLLLANRLLEFEHRKRYALDLSRASTKLMESKKLLCVSLQCIETDLFTPSIFPNEFIVHLRYRAYKSMLVYIFRCRKFPSIKYGTMKIQVKLLNHLKSGGTLDNFPENYINEWLKSIGE